MATKDKKAEYLQSEEGKRNAERFIKALKEGRLVCSVKSVSSSGMSRVISFCEVAKIGYPKKDRYALYQFNWFFKNLGWTYVNSRDAIRVGGCGMDMIFHVLYSVCGTLEYYGFKMPKDWSSLADNYMKI